MRIVGTGAAAGLYRTVLDIIYLALTLALFALVSLIATGVENLGPRSRSSAHRGTTTGEEAR